LALEIDYRRKTRTMAAVGAGVFLATVDGSIIHAPPPTLVRALNTEFSVVQRAVPAYLPTVATPFMRLPLRGSP